jgi:hypothetical protein
MARAVVPNPAEVYHARWLEISVMRGLSSVVPGEVLQHNMV